jgi:hypothetical protein
VFPREITLPYSLDGSLDKIEGLPLGEIPQGFTARDYRDRSLLKGSLLLPTSGQKEVVDLTVPPEENITIHVGERPYYFVRTMYDKLNQCLEVLRLHRKNTEVDQALILATVFNRDKTHIVQPPVLYYFERDKEQPALERLILNKSSFPLTAKPETVRPPSPLDLSFFYMHFLKTTPVLRGLGFHSDIAANKHEHETRFEQLQRIISAYFPAEKKAPKLLN